MLFADLKDIKTEVPAGNSHNAANNSTKANGKSDDNGDNDDEKPKVQAETARKEKSVLQAKLTKLAIQIGYGGTCTFHTESYPFRILDLLA